MIARRLDRGAIPLAETRGAGQVLIQVIGFGWRANQKVGSALVGLRHLSTHRHKSDGRGIGGWRPLAVREALAGVGTASVADRNPIGRLVGGATATTRDHD